MKPDVRALLRRLAVVDQRAVVQCACVCAESVIHLVPGRDARGNGGSSRVDSVDGGLELVDAWVRGRATRAACHDAADALRRRGFPSVSAMAHALRAAAHADPHDVDVADDVGAEAVGAAEAAATAMARHHDSADAGQRHLEHLFERVRAEVWPMTGIARPQGLPSAVRVAWDCVADDPRSEHTVAELLVAHERAERLGLHWSEPVERALAERIVDEARIGAVLASGLPGPQR